MSRLTFIMVLSIATLLIALGLQYRQQSTPGELGNQRQHGTEPDFYLTGTTSSQYNELGELHYRFESNKLEHFNKGDYTLIDAPNVTFFSQDGTPWHINSQKGRITGGPKLIKLWNNVELRRETPESPLRMKTQALTIQPDQNIASTDQNVVITSQSGRVDATGMKAYINENRVKLLSNVRVRHEPIKFD